MKDDFRGAGTHITTKHLEVNTDNHLDHSLTAQKIVIGIMYTLAVKAYLHLCCHLLQRLFVKSIVLIIILFPFLVQS